MLTVTIKNLTSARLPLDEIYANLEAKDLPGDTLVIERTAAQLDAMDALKTLVSAGSVSVTWTNASTDVDALSVPGEQHGTKTGLLVDGVAVVTSAVTFAKAFATGVTPVVTASIVQGAATDWQGQVYVRSVTNTGFTIALDVTDAAAAGGATCSVTWSATY
jgi:hypothetical protein